MTVAIRRYLRQLDRVLPAVVSGFYLVGSVALGAYRDGRSDIDFIAVLGRDLRATELRRLCFQHLWSGLTTGARAIRHGRSPMTGTCNGSFIMGDHVSLPVSEIVPVASHVGRRFHTGRGGSEVNPVGWKVLAERGVTIRGPRPDALGLDPQLAMLRSWNVANLEGYCRSDGDGHQGVVPPAAPAIDSVGRARCATPAPHDRHWRCDLQGGRRQLRPDVFGRRWHPLVTDTLAYWRQEASTLRLSPEDRRQQSCEFVTEVIDSAGAIGSTPTT